MKLIMSYILDALKKIEYEKNRKKLSDGRVNISGDLFKERMPFRNRAGLWKTTAVVSVILVLVCMIAWLSIKGKSTVTEKAIRTMAQQQSPAPVDSPAIKVTPRRPVPAAPHAAPPHTAVADEESAGREISRSKKQAKHARSLPAQTGSTIQPPAGISLSGIAWHDDRTSRRAVINGFLFKVDSVVSGAKITDILADRVRFSSPAGVFDIKLDSVLPVEGNK